MSEQEKVALQVFKKAIVTAIAGQLIIVLLIAVSFYFNTNHALNRADERVTNVEKQMERKMDIGVFDYINKTQEKRLERIEKKIDQLIEKQ